MASRQDAPARTATPPSQGRIPIAASVLGRLRGRIFDPGKARFREDIDPDDAMGGFGLWSGTSFTEPALAAQLAARMPRSGTLDPIDAPERRRARLDGHHP